MELVSRHLGDYRIKFNNPFDYSLFVSTYLNKNVISDFRYKKIIPYIRDKYIKLNLVMTINHERVQ